jgi:AcrR family transcriptional regulator
MAKSRRGLDTRRKILNAAAEIFAEKGFRGTTVRQICQKANANLAAIKYHFGCKEDLYVETFRYLFGDPDMKEVNQISLDIHTEEQWHERMLEWARLLLSRVSGKKPHDEWRSQLFLWERANPSSVFPVILKEFFMPYRRKLDELLRLGLPENVSDDTLMIWNVATLAQCTVFCTRAPQWREVLFPEGLSYDQWLDAASRQIAESVTSRLHFQGSRP